MTNHVHLLLTPKSSRSAGDLLKRLGQRYVQYINRTYGRTGTLWEGRYRSCLVQEEKYLLTCQRYIELNPVRAGIVEHPGEFRWSSYRHNGQGEKSDLITPHILYQNLGETNDQKQSTLYETPSRSHSRRRFYVRCGREPSLAPAVPVIGNYSGMNWNLIK
jgi:putative transposase